MEVLFWGPDRGNPTLRRQGRGPEFTGRLAGGWLRWRVSVRAGLEEAVGARWWRTRVKRRKASVVGEPARSGDALFLLGRGRIGDVIAAKSHASYPRRSAGFRPVWSVGPRTRWTEADGPAEVGGSRSTGRRGNARQAHGFECRGQGKAISVDEAVSQLRLPIATAEAPGGGPRGGSLDRSGGRPEARVPKAVGQERKSVPEMLDEVVERLGSALVKVVLNKGAPGPDGMTAQSLREQWPVVSRRLEADLLSGCWRPGEVRRVLIPKAGGGMRGLGIPNVTDRVVMEAIRLVLEPVFEPTFHPSSHGFRPGRSCHTAIAEAGRHLQDGHEWVVDIDLEKFFDRVNHQRLMARLATRVPDRRLLVLVGRLLTAKVVLPDGVVVATDEGVPQGSPLSPLLSNIVLDELDRELARRGHRFVRYADDCNVYVRSERAGLRVMASLERFINSRLRLKINREKSAVALPKEDQRVADWLASVLRYRCGQRRVHASRAGRPHPSASTRDPAQALETAPDDRPQPRRSRGQTAERVETGLRRTKVHVGAEPQPGGEQGHAREVLHGPWPDPLGRSARPIPTGRHRPAQLEMVLDWG